MLVPSLRGLTKTAIYEHPSKGLSDVQIQAIIGALGGGVLGAGAGYVLSDKDKKKRGMLAGGLTGAGLGGLGGVALNQFQEPSSTVGPRFGNPEEMIDGDGSGFQGYV